MRSSTRKINKEMQKVFIYFHAYPCQCLIIILALQLFEWSGWLYVLEASNEKQICSHMRKLTIKQSSNQKLKMNDMSALLHLFSPHLI